MNNTLKIQSAAGGSDDSGAAAPQLFKDNEPYSVAEIAERLKCSVDVVDRKMKLHRVRSVRFGSKKFMGGDINKVIAAEFRAD